jgi:IclR family transcriptional regulator, KDG regulon repressor
MPRVKTSTAPADGVLAVTLTFSIVEALARSRAALGVTELSNIVDATKSRIHRHLVTLVRAGYVAQDAQTEKYRIGARMVSLAQNIAIGIEIVATARPVLGQLRDDFGHTAVLAKLEGDRIRVLDVALGTSDYAIVQRAGNSLPRDMLHCSALGKIALAFGPAELLQSVLSRPLAEKTARTLDDPRALKGDLDRVRNRGWASVPDEGIVGFNAVAAPILDSKNCLAAMIGIIGATRALPAKLPSNLTDGVRRAGAMVTEALGGGVGRS